MTTSRGFGRFAASVLLIVLGVTVSVPASAADVDDFRFASLDAEYTLTRDDDGVSRMRVVEDFVAVFPDADQNHGMRRVIPDEYRGRPLRPDVISVTDGNGREWDVETDDVDNGIEIVARDDAFLRGEQRFVFTYTLDGVVNDFPDTGLELYWDVNGVDWKQSFDRVTSRLVVGPELADAVGASACYAGRQGATDACDSVDLVQTDDGVSVTATARDLGPGETLTMAVGFEEGTFVALDTSYTGSPWSGVQVAALLALLGVLGWALALLRGVLRDAPGRPTVVAEFTPPAGVDALESAVFLAKPGKAIPAEVLEQAVAGSIRIMAGEKPRWGQSKLVAELVDPARADGDGRLLLEGLFPTGVIGETYEFGSQDTRLSKTAQRILSEASAALKARGLYRPVPLWRRLAPQMSGFILAGVVVVCSIVMLDAAVDPLWPVLALIVSILLAIAVLLLTLHTPLTEAGAEVRDHLAGLRRFIEWAEADRIRTLQSPEGAERRPVDVGDAREMLHLYETLLPYAVVFGQEAEWSRRLAVLYDSNGLAAPTWYAGATAFNAASFSAGIGSLSAAASSSSSTGGSAGGGAAGGGGGGGGGGGV